MEQQPERVAGRILDTDYFPATLGFAYRLLNNNSILTEEHCHNFYEYFFIVSGSIIHIVNGSSQVLNQGDLVLIRPNDRHKYNLIGDPFEMINVGFSSERFDELCTYIGMDVRQMVESMPGPPSINMSAFQENSLIHDHEFLNFYSGDYNYLLMRLKLLLLGVVGFFVKYPMSTQGVHEKDRLQRALEKMNSQENLEEGITALLRVTGFSHGHLCRLMRQHMNTTPNMYIQNLRLTYASNLLLNSDMDILTISIRVGYKSVSHFIRVFKNKFGLPPHQFRKMKARKEL